jgi:hypothetical protein
LLLLLPPSHFGRYDDVAVVFVGVAKGERERERERERYERDHDASCGCQLPVGSGFVSVTDICARPLPRGPRSARY